MSPSKNFTVSLIVVNLLVLIGLVALSVLANNSSDSGLLFNGTLTNLSDKYFPSEITPPWWMFIADWSLVYFMQFLWLLYYGYKVMTMDEDSMIPAGWLVLYLAVNAGALAWLFTFDREYFTASLVVSVVATTDAILVAALSHKKDEWNHVLLQNALTVYATWMMIVTALTAGVVAKDAGVDAEDTVNAVLAAIMVVFSTYAILDLGLLSAVYTKYSYGSYVMILLYAIGLIINASSEKTMTIPIAMVSYTAVILACKITAVVYRCMKE